MRWRTPLQSRLCNPGGSRPPLLFRICDCRLAIGRLVMHERSGNHGGLTPPALGHMRSRIAKVAFPCKRVAQSPRELTPLAPVSAEMRLYSVKVAFSAPSERRAPGAAGVNPPCDRETPLQRRGAIARETAGQRVGGGRCNRSPQPRGAHAVECADAVPGEAGLQSHSPNHGGSRPRSCFACGSVAAR